MVQMVNPLQSVQQGQQFVDGLFTQRANQDAGRALATGNYNQAAGALFNSGDLSGGMGVQQYGQAKQAQQQQQSAAQKAQQLQATLQIVGTVKRARDSGQDVSQILPQYRDAFIAMGTDPQQLMQIEQQVAANPAFLDQIEQIVGQQARELEIVNLGGGTAVAVDKGTGREVNRFEGARQPLNVGGVLVDPQTYEPILDTREPKYQTIQNTDGSTSLVAIDQPVPRSGGTGGSGSGVPRGMRNNNPGNIEDGPFARSLPGYSGSDGRFAIFSDLSSGEGAQARLLQSYVQRGFDTPAEIINRWAPPSDGNPTNAYVNYVARRVGVGPNDRISAEQIPLVAQAIREFENGGQSASNGRPAAVASSGSARVVAQGENRGLSPAQQRAQDTADRAERRMDNVEQNSSRRDEVNLRREFNNRQEVKDFRTVQSAYNSVQAAARNPSAAGDLSLIFAYMKILDPGSVVREQEFANAQNAAGVPDRIRNLYNRALNGQRLNPNQRNDFLSQANNLFQTRQQTYRGIENEYRGYAESYGVSPDRVAPTQQQPRQSGNAPGVRFNLSEAQLQTRQRVVGEGGRPTSPLGSTQNPRYLNPSDPRSSYNNVKSGEYYVAPDGQLRRKP